MKKLLFIILFITLSACGFKVINLSELENYNIVEISSTGESKINYIIKNHLLRASKRDNVNELSIDITTKKNKIIKEKNIKNEITKYEIIITANINIKKIKGNEDFNFSVVKKGSYDVAKQNSLTRNNEKQLIVLLSNEMADEILNETNFKLNDS
tara:strand:+ start:713 stop:1177 length:465 start_codon:yes stop_codon:yes gene_type:complete